VTPRRHRLRTEHGSLALALALMGAATLALGAALVGAGGRDSEAATTGLRTIGYGQIAYAGLGPERWAQRWRQASHALLAARRRAARLERALRDQRRVLLARPQVVEAINTACATYGHCATLWRRAACETGGTLDPEARNPASGAAGLFQFLPSTWRTTPYGRFDVYRPYPNAMAAGWMHAHGRGGEWSCPW
jgi:hypothetical protein